MYIKMEIPVLVWSLKSCILSLTSSQMDHKPSGEGVLTAAAGRLGQWGVHLEIYFFRVPGGYRPHKSTNTHLGGP